jgi:hypothetical protein
MYFVAASRDTSQSLFLLVYVIDLILVIQSRQQNRKIFFNFQSASRECISKYNYNLNILYIIENINYFNVSETYS